MSKNLRNASSLIAAAVLAASTLGCTGLITGSGDDDSSDRPGESAIGDPVPRELVGAGGRDITQFWPNVEVRGGENTKMLNYEMLKNEVMRATGRSWVIGTTDQWAANRGILGGADWVTSWNEDRNPSQAKIITIRKMALKVCLDAVNADAGQTTRTLFTDLDPDLTIDPAAAITRTQVSNLYERIFLDTPAEEEITDALSALTDLQTINGPRLAWRGLCGAYLSSMRFLTY